MHRPEIACSEGTQKPQSCDNGQARQHPGKARLEDAGTAAGYDQGEEPLALPEKQYLVGVTIAFAHMSPPAPRISFAVSPRAASHASQAGSWMR
jgi:hypothetical protein